MDNGSDSNLLCFWWDDRVDDVECELRIFYGEQDIIELHAFLDWMMKLPEDAEKQFQLELNAFEEEKQMKYVTTGERIAEARGADLQKRLIAVSMLRKNLHLETIAEVTGLTIEQVQQLQSQVIQD